MNRIYLMIIISFALSSCLTGGFDQNYQLDQHEAELAKAPKIESITINGTLLERNTQSLRVINAKIGDELNIKVEITSGKGAELEQVEFFRIYYYGEDFEEDPQPVDPNTNGFLDVSGQSYELNYTYTVPEEDDDGYAFEPGYVIQVFIRARNSLDNFGYKAFEIHLVE